MALRRDLTVNLALSVVSIAAMMLALREAARLLPSLVLGLMLLSRRLADLLANLVQCGTPHAARRFLSLTADEAERHRWFRASVLIWLLGALVFLSVVVAGARWWTPLLFGRQVTGPTLLVATALLAVSIAGTNLALSALMAARRFVIMNALLIANTSGWLLVSLQLGKTPDNLVLVQAGGALVLVSVALAAMYWMRSGPRTEPVPVTRGYVRETLTYGAPRTLSPLLEVLLLVVGPWLLRNDPAPAGALILAFALLRLSAAFVQPLALVGGVTGARLLGARDDAGLARGINFIVGSTAAVGIVLCAAGYPWLPVGLRLWLGPVVATSVESFASVLLIALVPYTLFQGLKPIIEAVWPKPWVLYVMLFSVALQLGAYAVARQFLDPVRSIMIAVPLALGAAGLGSLFPVRTLLRPAAYFGWLRMALVAVVVFLLNLLAMRRAAGLTFAATIAVAAATLVVTLGAATIVLIRIWPSACLTDVTQFLLPGLLPDAPVGSGRPSEVRIAFLSLTHRFDDTRVLHKEARALAEAGYDVMHVSPDYGTVAPRAIHGVQLVLYRTSPGRAQRLRRFVRLWWLGRTSRAHVLHCNEIESWLAALLVKLERPHTRVIFDVHEHYPSRFAEDRFPRWLQWGGGPGIRSLFRMFAPFTDRLIFAKRSVAQDFPTRPGQASFIFNYAPLAVPVPARERIRPAIREDFGNAPVAVHIGDLSRERGWPQLLEALRRMAHRELRVITFGDVQEGTEPFWAEAERLGVRDRIEIRARVPYDRIFEYLAASTVGLMLYQPGILNHVYAFPMKLYDYMRAAIPSIGPRFAVEVTPVIESERCGWLIDTADPQELADALDYVCEHREEAREAGDRGRRAVSEKYNWEKQAAHLVELYRVLLAENGSTQRESSVRPVTSDRSTRTSAGRSEP